MAQGGKSCFSVCATEIQIMARPIPPSCVSALSALSNKGSHRETARIFQVSVRFVNNMVLLKARTGDLVASPQGGWPSSKLADHESFVLARIDENGDLTLDDLRKELEERGVVVHRSSVGRLLARHKRSFKKTVVASERLIRCQRQRQASRQCLGEQ